jgi:hypothetical protein
MFSKITHHVTEEHFEHPATLPEHVVHAANAHPLIRARLSSSDSLPPLVINEKTLNFRMDSRTIWTKYALGLINYSVASMGNLSEAAQVEARMSTAANAIGDYFIPYYGVTAGDQVATYLLGIWKTGVEVVHAVMAQKDLSPYQTIWASLIADLSNYLNKLNPAQWPVPLLTEIFTNLTKYWTDDIQARYNKDSTGDSNAIDNINKLVITGIPNHSNKGFTSLADVISRGIIAQFPLDFVG